MNFGGALEALKRNMKVSRDSWSFEEPTNIWLVLKQVDFGSGSTEPYLCICMPDRRFPWTPTQLDMLSEDWNIV